MSRSIPDTAIRAKVGQPGKAAVPRPLVLVIDPDATTRSVLEVGLARDGFEVWTADSGLAGLRLLEGRRPDAVVLESDLGGEEGFSFVARLRGDDRLATVPVLLLARAEDENVEALADVVGIDELVQRPVFARDVAALVRLELARRAGPGPCRFDAAALPPGQLLRALLACPRSGRLSLADGRAELRFRAGRVIDARFDGHGSTLETLVRGLALTRGEYALHLEPVEGFAELQCSLRELVQVVMPRLHRWARVAQRSLPLEARLQVDFGRLAQALKQLPDQINRVVQLFDGRRSVQDALIDSPFDETTTLEVSTRLYLMGVLSPARGEAGELVLLKPMPRLFEPRAAEAEELMAQLFAGTAEIRADEGGADDDEDWYTLAEGVTGLEVPEPDGGWTTAPIPEALAAGLSPEVTRQLDAFHTPMRVEKPEVVPGTKEARRFAEGAEEPAGVGLEQVVREASETSLVADEELEQHRLSATGRQSRIETPWMTPVVHLEAAPPVEKDRQARIETPWLTPVVAETPATTAAHAAAPSVIVEPTLERAVTPVLMPALIAAGALDRGAAPSAPLAASVTADVEAGFFAEASPGLDAREFEAPAGGPGRWWLFAVAAAGLLLLIAGFEALRARPEVSAPAPKPPPAVTAPVFLPDIDAPEFIEVEEEAAVLELPPEPIEASPVDVGSPLAEARGLYETRQYAAALALLQQVIADEPRSVAAWLLLGLVRYDAMDAAGAQAAADRVLALDPDNARVQVLLATLRFDANDREGGKAALRRYLELDPSGPHAAEARALLRR